MRLPRSFIVLLLVVASVRAQVRVVTDSVSSPSLQRWMRYQVVLPASYDSTGSRYPVLYLLHGFNGNETDWVRNTRLTSLMERYRFIVVTPDGRNSWYTNAPGIPNERYEDAIMLDLLPEIDRVWPTRASRSGRGIGGLSMGGYGAAKLGLRYDSMFAFVACLSPAIQFPAGLEDPALVARRSKESNASVRRAFGPVRSPHWEDNDVYALLARADTSLLPFFYLSVGSQDGISEIIDHTHTFAAALRKRQARFDMHEGPGAHRWDFWNHELPLVLDRFEQQISALLEP